MRVLQLGLFYFGIAASILVHIVEIRERIVAAGGIVFPVAGYGYELVQMILVPPHGQQSPHNRDAHIGMPHRCHPRPWKATVPSRLPRLRR